MAHAVKTGHPSGRQHSDRPSVTVRHGIVIAQASGPSRWFNRAFGFDKVLDRIAEEQQAVHDQEKPDRP